MFDRGFMDSWHNLYIRRLPGPSPMRLQGVYPALPTYVQDLERQTKQKKTRRSGRSSAKKTADSVEAVEAPVQEAMEAVEETESTVEETEDIVEEVEDSATESEVSETEEETVEDSEEEEEYFCICNFLYQTLLLFLLLEFWSLPVSEDHSEIFQSFFYRKVSEYPIIMNMLSISAKISNSISP